MKISVLPPIVWIASCGHRNEVRCDRGGFAVSCKMCGAKVWCPKRKATGSATAGPPLARKTSSRSAARRRVPPHAAGEGEVDVWRRRPTGEPVPEGFVVSPARPGEGMVPAEPGRKRGTRPPAPGQIPAPTCRGCRAEPRRAARWSRAAWQLELSPEAVSAGLPGVLELCGSHVRHVPREAIVVLRRWQAGRWLLVPRIVFPAASAWCQVCGGAYDPGLSAACPCGRVAFISSGGTSPAGSPAAPPAGRPSPNPTAALSGVYRQVARHRTG